MTESEVITANTENACYPSSPSTGTSGTSGSNGPNQGKWYDVYYKKHNKKYRRK